MLHGYHIVSFYFVKITLIEAVYFFKDITIQNCKKLTFIGVLVLISSSQRHHVAIVDTVTEYHGGHNF